MASWDVQDTELVIELNCELYSKQVFIKCSIFDKKVAKNNTRFDEIIQNLAKKNESLLLHNS